MQHCPTIQAAPSKVLENIKFSFAFKTVFSFQHKHWRCLNLFLELPEEAQTSSLCGPQYCLRISALPAMPFYHSTAKKLFIAQMGRTDEQNLLHPAVQTSRNKISSHILAYRRRAVRALKISRVSPGWEEVWR